MMLQKKWNFGIGSVFSLIVVYFIYLYSKDKGWALLASISKWYLIIIGGLMAFSLIVIFLVFLISILILLFAMIKLRLAGKRHKADNNSPE